MALSKRDPDPIDDLRAAREAAGRIASTVSSLAARYAALTTEIYEVTSAPPSLAEVCAQISRLVDDAVVAFHEEQEITFLDTLAGRRAERGDGANVAPMLPRVYSINGLDSLGFAQFAALMPEETKALLTKWAKASTTMRWGLPPEERATRLETLRAELATVRDQHTALVDAANAEGLNLPLLDEVRETRAAAARDEARRQELERQRAILAQQAAAPPIAAYPHG